MLSRIASPFTFALLATLAVISPVTAIPTKESEPSIGDVQCNTGPVQCCNSIQSASDPTANLLLGLLNIVVSDLNVPIGVTCTPISVIAGVLSGNDCTAQPVCCENNNFAGVVAIGCTAINI